MSQRVASSDWSAQQCKFDFAPPRHFLLPAILLLVSEKPGYGYSLVKDLEKFRFGQVERPSVYRALAQLEADGFVESWSEAPKAGQARRVYGLTECGERVLRAWMGVVKEERDCLDGVLRRYQATGTTDAALAEIEGGWAVALGHSWSPPSTSLAARRRATPNATRPRETVTVPSEQRSSEQPPVAPQDFSHGIDELRRDVGRNGRLFPAGSTGDIGGGEPAVRAAALAPASPPLAAEHRRFRVVPARSVVMIEARSSVGPIRFGAVGLTGSIEAQIIEGVIAPHAQPSGHLEISVGELRSGNSLYDAELLRRIDARHFPKVTLDLRETNAVVVGERYRLDADVAFHGVTRPMRGTVWSSLSDDRKLVVTGEQAFDIRDFMVASPTMLMLRIYPDVQVRLHVEAELED